MNWECFECGEVWDDELPPTEYPYCDSIQIYPIGPFKENDAQNAKV